MPVIVTLPGGSPPERKPAEALELLRRKPQKFRGIAAEISRIAGATHDVFARADLNDLAPRVARLERALDEIVANALEELRIAARQDGAS